MMATRLGAVVWWTALAVAIAGTAGQHGYQGRFATLFVHRLPSTSGPHLMLLEHSVPAPHTYNKSPSGQPLEILAKIASSPVNTSDGDNNGTRPARAPLQKRGPHSASPRTPDPSETAQAASEAHMSADTPAPGPAPSPGYGPELDLDIPERTCVFVCLIDVACSRTSSRCDNRVFLAGSYWCRFFSECPPFDPVYTVFYIPYKPLDAPVSSGVEGVVVSPPGPVKMTPGDVPPTPGTPLSASVAVGPPIAPAEPPALPITPVAVDRNASTAFTEPSGTESTAADFTVSPSIPPSALPAAPVLPAPDVSGPLVVGDVPPPIAGAAVEVPSATTVARPGTVPPSRPAPRPMPPPAPRPFPRPVPPPERRPSPKPTPGPKPGVRIVLPQCTYICEEEVCNSDMCIPVPGSSVCTFMAMCPPDAPEPRTIHLPLEAETDPPEEVVPVPAPEPSNDLVLTPAPGPWTRFIIGG